MDNIDFPCGAFEMTDTDAAAINKKIDEICNFTYVIEKKLRVPKTDAIIYNETTQFEEAYLAEDKNKTGTFNLLIKIGTDGSTLGEKIRDITTGKNIDFKLKRIAPPEPAPAPAPAGETELKNITINYKIGNEAEETLQQIYIHELNNVNVEWLDKTEDDKIYSNIYVLDTGRTKTGQIEALRAYKGTFTEQEKQALTTLEDKIISALKNLVGYSDSGLSGETKTELGILKTTWNTLLPTKSDTTAQNAVNSIRKIFSSFTLPDDLSYTDDNTVANITTKQVENPLIKDLKEYNRILGSKGATAFKLNFTKGENRGIYGIIKNLIYNISGALRQGLINKKAVETLTDNKNKILLSYIPELNKAFKSEEFGAIAATKTGYVAQRALPTGFGVIPAAKGIFNLFGKKPTQPGGSIKYQQKRYKVHERDDGARYITLDKKNYTLKMSSKGTYITRDGKRQYL